MAQKGEYYRGKRSRRLVRLTTQVGPEEWEFELLEDPFYVGKEWPDNYCEPESGNWHRVLEKDLPSLEVVVDDDD